MPHLNIRVLPETFSIHRSSPESRIPTNLLVEQLVWIARTNEELSIVCESRWPIEATETSAGWSCLQVIGPLEFSLIGILAGIAKVLADADISIFALSTFDTDYILVPTEQCENTVEALKQAGYGFPQR
ncbi:MAG: ACT domain-containing protein [Gemmataceae bacterium]